MQIWKYELDAETTVLEVPKGAKPVAAGLQGVTQVVWAEVDPSAEKAQVTVTVWPTGYTIAEDAGQYVGTFTTKRGFVFHVYWNAAE